MRFTLLGVAAVSVAVAGCSVAESFRVTSTVLVKVPNPVIVPPMQAHNWHFRHVLQAPEAEESQWYVAWNNENPLRTAIFTPYWKQLYARAPEIADASRAALGAYPILLEPNRTFARFAPRQESEVTQADPHAPSLTSPRTLVYAKKPSSSWPVGKSSSQGWPDSATHETGGLQPDPDGRRVVDPVWYLRDEYSQLATARDRVGIPPPGKAVRIGHLDNGYDDRHLGLPEHLLREKVDSRYGSLANAVGRLEYEENRSRRGESPASQRKMRTLFPPEPVGTGTAIGTHGLGTIGILAGGQVDLAPVPGRIAGYRGYLGGAPQAEIIPVRVAPWVISLNTAELAYAIDYASRQQQCDIISLSHGGAPTQAWVDAVNAAYERGTAIFAAESDFVTLLGNPLRPNGIVLPSSPIYPAAFRRVVGVTGVAEDGGSYGRNQYWRLALHPLDLFSWCSRGSYGADGTSTVLFRPSRQPDPDEVEALGALRAYPLAAFSPNIPWLKTREVDGVAHADGLELNGSGTSAATPQVSAAAALWLQKNRATIERHGDWHDWRKPEAVYYALLRTADRTSTKGKPDLYLGAGEVKANDALRISYDSILSSRPGEDLRFGKAPEDLFDGAQSVAAILGFGTLKHVPDRDRARLWQQSLPGESRQDALTRLYYNLGLLREWHGGDLPEICHQSYYWKQAQGRAAAAPPPTPHPRAVSRD